MGRNKASGTVRGQRGRICSSDFRLENRRPRASSGRRCQATLVYEIRARERSGSGTANAFCRHDVREGGRNWGGVDKALSVFAGFGERAGEENRKSNCNSKYDASGRYSATKQRVVTGKIP